MGVNEIKQNENTITSGKIFFSINRNYPLLENIFKCYLNIFGLKILKFLYISKKDYILKIHLQFNQSGG